MNIIRLLSRLRVLFRRDFFYVILGTFILNIFFGILFFITEKQVQDISIFDAIWWSMVTMTTVGYGDYYAKTAFGRFLISYPCMILGIGVIGYLVGMVTNFLIDFASRQRRGLLEITFKNHIVICNYPGEKKILGIVKELDASHQYAKSRFVLVTDKLTELPEALKNQNIYFVNGTPTDETILLKANILNCSGVIVLAEDPRDHRSDERTFLIGSLLELIEKEKNIKIKTITEIINANNIRNLIRADVDGYISEDGMSGCLIVQEFINPGVNKIISQVISNAIGSQFYLHDTSLVDLKIRDVQIGALEHDINLQVIGLIRHDESILNPSKDTKIDKNDKLIVLAERGDDFKQLEVALLKTVTQQK